MLNQRVFFWPSEKQSKPLLTSKGSDAHRSMILVFDTLSLIRDNYSRVEISPINSGNTRRKPTRRGLATFAALPDLDYTRWREHKDRKSKRSVQEIVVRDGVMEMTKYLIDRKTTVS